MKFNKDIPGLQGMNPNQFGGPLSFYLTGQCRYVLTTRHDT